MPWVTDRRARKVVTLLILVGCLLMLGSRWLDEDDRLISRRSDWKNAIVVSHWSDIMYSETITLSCCQPTQSFFGSRVPSWLRANRLQIKFEQITTYRWCPHSVPCFPAI